MKANFAFICLLSLFSLSAFAQAQLTGKGVAISESESTAESQAAEAARSNALEECQKIGSNDVLFERTLEKDCKSVRGLTTTCWIYAVYTCK
jgi:hypothetical protein